jgi:hypothetical protein
MDLRVQRLVERIERLCHRQPQLTVGTCFVTVMTTFPYGCFFVQGRMNGSVPMKLGRRMARIKRVCTRCLCVRQHCKRLKFREYNAKTRRERMFGRGAVSWLFRQRAFFTCCGKRDVTSYVFCNSSPVATKWSVTATRNFVSGNIACVAADVGNGPDDR